jgi:hypothetical protein
MPNLERYYSTILRSRCTWRTNDSHAASSANHSLRTMTPYPTAPEKLKLRGLSGGLFTLHPPPVCGGQIFLSQRVQHIITKLLHTRWVDYMFSHIFRLVAMPVGSSSSLLEEHHHTFCIYCDSLLYIQVVAGNPNVQLLVPHY